MSKQQINEFLHYCNYSKFEFIPQIIKLTTMQPNKENIILDFTFGEGSYWEIEG